MRISIVCISIIVLLFPSFAGAQSDSTPIDRGYHTRLAKVLELTTEQKTEIRKLHQEMQPVRQEHISKKKALRNKIKEESLKENPSREILSDLARQTGELEQLSTQNHADHILKLKEILTPEQFAKLMDKGPPRTLRQEKWAHSNEAPQ